MENLHFDLRYYLEILYRRKWFIAIVFVLFCVGGVLYTAKQPKIYKASATLSITPPTKRNIAGIEVQEKIDAHMQYFVNTQKQILQNTGTMRLLIERLDSGICEEFFGRPKNDVRPESVLKQISITHRRNTYIFEIGVIGKQPQLCADIANLLVEIYIEEYNRNEKSLQGKVLTFLTQGLPDRKQKLIDAEEEIKDIEKKHKDVLLYINSENPYGSLEKIIDKIQDVDVELVTKKNYYDKCAQARKKGTLKAIMRLEFFRASELFTKLREKEFDLQQQYEENRLRYQPQHRKMIWLKKSIDNTHHSIEQEARLFVHRTEQEYLGLVYKKQKLQKLLKKEQNKILRERQIHIDYQHAKRQYDLQLETYNSFMDKVGEIKAASGYEVNNVQSIYKAFPPNESDIYRPRKILNYLMSAFLGLICGVIAVFLLESLDDTVQGEKDIREIVDTAVLGNVPFISTRRYGKDIESVVTNHSRSPIAEAFRRLSLKLLLEEKQKIYAITSPSPGDGKTLITTNICQTLAKSKKVLLIDADLYKPRVHTSLNISQQSGFGDLIQGHTQLNDVLVQLNDNLWCIPAGNLPADPHQTIFNSSLDELLNDLEKEYDYIIFDTPPLGLISDVLLLANVGTKIFLVVSVKKCKKKFLQSVIKRFEGLQTSLHGVIFNHKTKSASDMDEGYYDDYYGN